MEEKKITSDAEFEALLNELTAQNRAELEKQLDKRLPVQRKRSKDYIVSHMEMILTAAAYVAFNALFIILAHKMLLDVRVAWGFGVVSTGIFAMKSGLFIGQRI